MSATKNELKKSECPDIGLKKNLKDLNDQLRLKNRKICRRCGENFPRDNHHFYAMGDYFSAECKPCARFLSLKPKEVIPDGFKKCSKCKILKEKNVNNFTLNRKTKDNLGTCRECSKKYYKNYFSQDENKQRRNKNHNRCYHNNLNKSRARSREQYQKRKKNGKERQYKQKRREDVNYRIKETLSSRVRSALKLQKVIKAKRTRLLIGCEVDFLKSHLEKQFYPKIKNDIIINMTWENYGLYGWHIEHIKPCCSFDLTKEEEQKKCFHWSNLRPMWAEENFNKIKDDLKLKIK